MNYLSITGGNSLHFFQQLGVPQTICEILNVSGPDKILLTWGYCLSCDQWNRCKSYSQQLGIVVMGNNMKRIYLERWAQKYSVYIHLKNVEFILFCLNWTLKNFMWCVNLHNTVTDCTSTATFIHNKVRIENSNWFCLKM